MKKISMSVLLLSLAFVGLSQQTLTPVEVGSKVGFSIKNFGLNTNGSFGGIKGSITYNAANMAATVFNVTVDANTVNTNNSKRDEHLKKDEYFDVAKFTVLSFQSNKVTPSIDGTATVEGRITIKGVSKVISFPFKVTALSVGYLFQGSFELNRRDFDVGGSSAVLGDKLKVALSVFAK